ncbi:MAG TPA: type VI immunity family protein [Polyangiaceae bacterium]|nr:type VI immunity family protein [Polyangiaceae bacterium]
MRIWNFDAPVGQLGLDDDLCVRSDSGEVLCCMALVVTLFIREGDRPEVREGMIRALGRLSEISGAALTWGMHPESELPEPVSAQGALADVRRWPAAVFERFDFQMIFTAGKSAADASPLRFMAVSREREEGQLSFISLSLPVRWALKNSPEAFTAFVLELCNWLGPTHGYAGLGVVPHVLGFDDESQGPLFALARRFPGLDLDLPAMHEPFLSSRRGIKGVNWLTVLGDEWIAELGGGAAIQPKLDSQIGVFPYRGGVVLQAGASPTLDDRNPSASLAPYRRVGAALAPVRIKGGMMMRVDSGSPGFDLEEAERWLSRFEGRD